MAKVKTEQNFMESMAGAGLENISPDDVIIPRIKVLQALSPELDDSAANFIKGSKVGDFILSVPGVSLGKSITIIPLAARTYWMEWQPNRGGFVARHEPGSIEVDKTDFSNWVKVDNGNDVQESRDWFVLVKDMESYGPVIMSFTSTQIKASKTLMSMISMERTPGGNIAPIFAFNWILESIKNTNDKGSWYNISSTPKKGRMITQKEYTNFIENARGVVEVIQSQGLPAPHTEQIEHKEAPGKKPTAKARKAGVEEIDY